MLKEKEHKDKLEISVQQKQQIEHELIGHLHPKTGHKVFKICKDTLEIREANYTPVSKTYYFGQENKKEIIIEEGYAYVCALNVKNAKKYYLAGKTGSRNVEGILKL